MYKSILDNLPGNVFIIDENGKTIFWNKKSLEITGYSENDLMRMKPEDFFNPDEKNGIESLIQEINKKGEGAAELTFITKSGKKLPFYYSGSLVEFNNKKCIMGIGVDITQKKQIDDAIKESEDKFKTIFESSPDALLLVDRKGKIIEINNKVYEWLGYKKENLIGTNLIRLPFLGRKEKVIVMKNFFARMKGEEIKPYELEFKTKDGKSLLGEVNATIIHSSNDEKITDLIRVANIYDKKEREFFQGQHTQEMEVLNTVAMAGNRAKTIQDVMKTIIDSTIALFGYDGGCIYLVEDDKTAVVKYSNGFSSSNLNLLQEIDINAEPYRKVFIEGKEIISSNYPKMNPIHVKELKIISLASIPLKSENKIIGALNMAMFKPHIFSDFEKETLKSIGRESGIVFSKVMLNEELKTKTEALENSKNILERKVKNLERFTRLSVGRELKMMELKKRIKELEKLKEDK